RFYARQFQLNSKLDGLIIAKLEMQERHVGDPPPIPAVERLAANQIQRRCDRAALRFGDEQHALLAHALAQEREELAVKVGRAPFPRAGVLIAAIEKIPVARRDLTPAQTLHMHPLGRALAFPADGLALLRGEIGEKIRECRVAAIEPVI